jgi:AcrR family transcriptional regulator
MSQDRERGPRARDAMETRRRMLAAARELFTERGYGATTLQDVATRAGVAVQTIYYTFGKKRTLLKELVDVTIAGDLQPVATMDRPWFRDALAARTAAAQLRAQVRGSRQVLERIAPIIEVVNTAVATDPEVAELWPQDPDPRYAVLAAAANTLVTKPDAREGVSAEHAADLLYAVLSPELYLLLVRDRGWSSEQWEQCVYDILRSQLCSGSGP